MSKPDLPPSVIDVIERSVFTQFATVSTADVPIDTPTYCFPSDDLSHIGVATGLAYPAKAGRARRNPKVGLLLDGMPGEPVVSIRGMAAVRDADLQGNAERYIAETGVDMVSYGLPWDVARQAVWYWTRIIVEVAPERIMWWDNAEAMDAAPHVWNAPAGFAFPASDASPPGKTSPAAKWDQRPWQSMAEGALARGAPAHLTLCDADGFPLPIGVRSCELMGDRFRVDVPKGAPWSATGKATLTFQGLETFVGEAVSENGETWVLVERALPELPMMKDPKAVIQPPDDVKDKLLARLVEETARRGQPVPNIPQQVPAPTRIALRRKELIAQMMG